MDEARKVRIGVDIGGTFTDIVGVSTSTGEHSVLKVPSTPDDPIAGVVQGMAQLLEKAGWARSDVDVFIHGTTIATNTVIERTGARTGVITTHGFRDVLEVGRTERPPKDLYNLWMTRSAPLVPRRFRLGVRERTTAQGDIQLAPVAEDVEQAVRTLVSHDIEAVAVCLINSYINDQNEQAVAAMVRAMAPELYVVCSTEVNRQYREYERTSTAVVSAYVGKKMARYTGRLQQGLRELGLDVAVHIMQASGGVMTPDHVERNAVRTILSGPAGGVLGGVSVGAQLREPNFVTLDMGGTSTDVAIVEEGRVHRVDEHEEGGLFVRMPMLDISTIGAGGGSIAWVDAGGALKVGPMSAGAVPGPACYGLGGTKATVTDANVVLGYIDPDNYLGGTRSLDAALATEAVTALAEELDTTPEDAALGIIRVANANMVRAIKQVTTLKGRDPREFALMPFGGAGPLHAGSLIREMRMPRAIVPLYPGVLSACGMVSADLEYVHTTSVLERMDRLRSGALEELYQALQAQGLKEMVESGVDAERVHFRRRARARYLRQVRELLIDVGEGAGSPEEALQSAFDAEHEQRFGFSTDDPIEVIDIELSSVCPPDSDIHFDTRPSGGRLQARESRTMLVEGVGKTSVPVFNRDDLPLGESIAGPAVIEQYETNTVVLADQRVQLHESGVLVLEELKG